MTTSEQHCEADFSIRKRSHVQVLMIVMLIAVLIGFMAGRIVESTRYDYMKKAYMQQIHELEQQLDSDIKAIESDDGKAFADDFGETMKINLMHTIEY